MTAAERKAPVVAVRRRTRVQPGTGFLAPTVGVLFVLTIFPFLFSVVLSFSNVSVTNGLSIQFGSLANWTQLIHDHEFWVSLSNTVVFVVVAVLFEYIIGLLLAILLVQRDLRGTRFFRTVFLIPMTLASVAIAFTWRMLYNPAYGAIDAFLRAIGINGPVWLGNTHLALLSIAAVDVWEWTPFMFLLLLAGLQGIPAETLEAARVDGATWWKSVRYIIIPLVWPVSVAGILLRMIAAFQVFGRIYVMTGGGPGITTQSATLYAFYTGVTEFNLGYGSTLALALMVVVIVAAMILLAVTRRSVARGQI